MMCGDGVTAISALPYTIDIGAIEQAVIDAQAAQGKAEDAQGAAEVAAGTAATDTVNAATALMAGYVTDSQAAKAAAEEAQEGAEAAAGIAATETVEAASLLLSGYVTDAQTAKAAAETAQGTVESVVAEISGANATIYENKSSIKAIEETLINYNPTAETRLTQTTADRVVSLPKNAGEGGLKSAINGNTLKNETTYNRDTWAEWSFTNAQNAIKNSEGLSLENTTSAGMTTYILTKVKPLTKYGILFYVIINTFEATFYSRLADVVASPTIVIGNRVTGNIKTTITVGEIITMNRFTLGANGSGTGELKLKDVRIFELPAGSQIESDFTNLTADQLATRYPYIDGIKSVTAPRVKSVGKNLIKYNNSLPYTAGGITFGYDNGIYSVSGTATAYPYKSICVIPANSLNEGNYRFSKTLISGTSLAGIRVMDRTVTPAIVLASKADVAELTIGRRHNTLQIEIATSMSVTYDESFKLQLEKNIVATTYEPYKESFLYPEPKTLHRLPNGVCDTIENGNYIQRVEEYIVNNLSGWSFFYDVTYDIYDFASDSTWMTLNGAALFNGSNPNAAYCTNSDGFIPIHSSHDSSKWGGVDLVCCTSINGNLKILIKASKAITTIAGLQTYLNTKPIKLFYPLANPITTENITSGIPISYPSGSIYLEPALADAGVYTDKMSILQTAFPISSLESIKKINSVTGEETPLDVTTAIIAEDGLSFTHPNLALNDIVFFTYFYPETGCYGSNSFNYFDSRYVKVDSVTGKYYKIDFSIADGVPAFNLVEVV